MKKQVLKTVAISASLLLGTALTASAQTPEKPSVDEIFAKMDADKDGKLAEAEVDGPLKEKFAVIDADADGFITKEEMAAAPKPEKPMAE